MPACATSSISAEELKEKDPRRFEKEYSRWTEGQWDSAWYVEDTEAYFKEKYKRHGIEIETLNYSLGYSQGDYASFDGRVFLDEWMATVRIIPDGPTYAEAYPALFLACQEDGSSVTIDGEDSRRGWRTNLRESWWGVVPQGIFAGLDDEAWSELVAEQLSSADLEEEVRKYCEAIGREIYKMLQESYEAETSEEAFIESCDINGVTFDIEE
jgi:hypothetical protein